MPFEEPLPHNPPIIISPPKTKALIFDLDGTIIDNMSHHHLAWQEMLKSIGHDWSIEQVKAEIWGKNEEIFERIFPGRYTVEEARALAHQKELRYIKQYREHITMIDGLESLLVKAKAIDMKLAVATAAPRVCVDFVRETLDLENYFEVIVQADQVQRSKPHPETFLTAAERLGVRPDECIVFEDAPVGVRAADAAGMESYVMLTTHAREEFLGFHGVKGFIVDYCGITLKEGVDSEPHARRVRY